MVALRGRNPAVPRRSMRVGGNHGDRAPGRGAPVAAHHPVASTTAAPLLRGGPHGGARRAVEHTVPQAVRGQPLPGVPDRPGRRRGAEDPAPVPRRRPRDVRGVLRGVRLPEAPRAPRAGGGVHAGALRRGRHGR
jgi:hypothetical protein